MSYAATVRDWTQGAEGIAYQACPACSAVWYFHRTFCPRCGMPIRRPGRPPEPVLCTPSRW